MSNHEIDSNFKVPLTTIREINPHPNVKVERLLISKCFDYEIVIGKNAGYNVGDPVIYCPIASVLPNYIEEILFPPDSKIKLEKSRIRAIRIQGFVSQGMIIRPADLINGIRERIKLDHYSEDNSKKYTAIAKQLEGMICYGSKYLGKDLQDLLGITKYEPPHRFMKVGVPGEKKERNKSGENFYFRKYAGCGNIKWCPDLLQEGVTDVLVQIKKHGSNFRCALLPYTAKNTWQRILKFLHLTPKYEYVFGSNNVQLQNKAKDHKGFYDENYYLEMYRKYDLKNKLKPTELMFAELVGDKIQKNYDYGCKPGERKLIVFDLMYQDGKNARWATWEELTAFCKRTGMEQITQVYRGKWDKQLVSAFVEGPDPDYPSHVREGIVIKQDNTTSQDRFKLKWINPAYLMKESTGETSDGDG